LFAYYLPFPCRYPAFGQHAAIVFARHTGPFGIPDVGHFPQWEAAKIMNDAITMFCADRLRADSMPQPSPSVPSTPAAATIRWRNHTLLPHRTTRYLKK
jgi:hypothetical protein